MVTDFVASYGYLALFLGTLLEGETILFAAGFAAHQDLLNWPIVVAIAFAGGTLGDQLAFLLGRWKGWALIARFPWLAQRAPRVHALLERYHLILIISVRFLYGLRIAGPIVIGTSRVPMIRFAVLNMIGAIIWAVVISGAGYYSGTALETLVTDFANIEDFALPAILAAGFLWWLWKLWRGRTP